VNARSGVWARRAVWLAAAGLFLAANAGFFFWYRGTARERREALESRRSALEKDVEAKEAEAKKLAADRETLAPVVDEIHTILKKGGVSPAQISYATPKEAQGSLVPMNVAFSFKGEYARFKQLLDAFQSSRKWISVQAVALQRDPDMPGSVQVHVNLVTYFLPEEEPPAARTKMAGGTAR
jgi:hypothetical protein